MREHNVVETAKYNLDRHGKAIESLLGFQMERIAKNPVLIRALLESVINPVEDGDLLVVAAVKFVSIPEITNVLSEWEGAIQRYSRANNVQIPFNDGRTLAALLLAIKVRDFCHRAGLLHYQTTKEEG